MIKLENKRKKLAVQKNLSLKADKKKQKKKQKLHEKHQLLTFKLMK